ncbi:MAG: glycosyltransferase family 39 protein, partial [Candidatus Omnitrophica bacterium]|nr:glycosyltransferase family 39 protein [Candidatus Omnitrophota bacterium]
MKKGALRKKTALALLAVIMLCGLAARLHGMNRYSLWFDEYFHAFAAQGILEKGEPVLPSGELYGRASVYSYLVAAGFKLFGTGDIPARMPSVLLGVLSIGLTYMLASHWFSRRVGLISAFLMALSPFCILWSQMCRLYALFQPAYLLLVFFFF